MSNTYINDDGATAERFFSRDLMRNAEMTPEEEEMIRIRVCPMCLGTSFYSAAIYGVRFDKCGTCSTIFVTREGS